MYSIYYTKIFYFKNVGTLLATLMLIPVSEFSFLNLHCINSLSYVIATQLINPKMIESHVWNIVSLFMT